MHLPPPQYHSLRELDLSRAHVDCRVMVWPAAADPAVNLACLLFQGIDLKKGKILGRELSGEYDPAAPPSQNDNNTILG